MKETLKQLGIADVNPGGFAGDWLGSGASHPRQWRNTRDGLPGNRP